MSKEPAMYHLSRNGQSFGPYDLTAIRKLVAEGKLVNTDLILEPSTQQWIPLQTSELLRGYGQSLNNTETGSRFPWLGGIALTVAAVGGLGFFGVIILMAIIDSCVPGFMHGDSSLSYWLTFQFALVIGLSLVAAPMGFVAGAINCGVHRVFAFVGVAISLLILLISAALVVAAMIEKA